MEEELFAEFVELVCVANVMLNTITGCHVPYTKWKMGMMSRVCENGCGVIQITENSVQIVMQESRRLVVVSIWNVEIARYTFVGHA